MNYFKPLFTFISFITLSLSYAQVVTEITNLPDSVWETSGLIYINGKLVTHNDSGGDPCLYEIDTINGQVIRKVFVNNTGNTDWEDICHDSNYIYIGDFGNNNGSRTNLRIFRVSIQDYNSNDTISADTISFSYADQTNFPGTAYVTNHDAEGFIAYGDSLYIFSKNWGNYKTNIYPLSKTPGNYQLHIKDSINIQGMITGATFNPFDSTIILTGYTSPTTFQFNPFIVKLDSFNNGSFTNGNYQKSPMTGLMSYQIEGTTFISSGRYFVTSEKSQLGASRLYTLEYPSTQNTTSFLEVSSKSTDIPVYPNPFRNEFRITKKSNEIVLIFNKEGKLIKTSKDELIQADDLKSGVYTLKLINDNNQVIAVKKIIKL